MKSFLVAVFTFLSFTVYCDQLQDIKNQLHEWIDEEICEMYQYGYHQVDLDSCEFCYHQGSVQALLDVIQLIEIHQIK